MFRSFRIKLSNVILNVIGFASRLTRTQAKVPYANAMKLRGFSFLVFISIAVQLTILRVAAQGNLAPSG